MAQFLRYKPRRWQAEFDLIVLASFNGLDNKSIGEKFGYTPQHISNILCSEESEVIRVKLREKILTGADVNIASRLQSISEKAVLRLEAFMNNDSLALQSPFAFADRAFKVIAMAGQSLEKSPVINGNNTVNNTQINLGNDVFDRLTKALDKSSQVSEIHKDFDFTKERILEGGSSTKPLIPISRELKLVSSDK